METLPVKRPRFESIGSSSVMKKGSAYLARKDATLGKIIRKIGNPDFELHDDPYNSLIISIISQQISWAAASSILQKFRRLYKGKMPTPRQYLKTSPNRLSGAGVSPQKSSYLRDLCMRLESGELKLDNFDDLTDEQIINELDEVKGIGRWTAEMFLIFSLGRADVFPLDDLGIKKAVQRAYNLRTLPDKNRLEKISEKWAPYRSVAALYLWKNHD
ncbi:MAG: DNA-3-methyladenine glycosylase 2 family protein [Candidatus Micrarchaeota archaeon]|nr:DNA-3-methyladenine glycosylase 2 family protein [Candidatus Micrarchaeota archaeon]